MRCKPTDDRALLMEVKSIETHPAAETLTIGQFYLTKDACQRYLLGKHQRLVHLAITRIDR